MSYRPNVSSIGIEPEIIYHQAGGRSANILQKGPGFTEKICEFSMDVVPSTDHIPIGSMYAIYGNIYH